MAGVGGGAIHGGVQFALAYLLYFWLLRYWKLRS